MRDSLTVLAILLIGVLTAALVAPHLIDWDSHRALVERELSKAAGTPVAVAGRIDLALLPKPVFRLDGVAVGDGAGGRPRLTARALDVELSLAALLRGQVQVIDATLVGPELRLVQARDGGFGLASPAGASADRFAFDHLALRDGTLALALADGRQLALRGIDLDGEAASLRGPFKATGSVLGQAPGRGGSRSGATAFRLNTGALDAGASGSRLRVKLHLDGTGAGTGTDAGGTAGPSLDLDGVAAARPGGLGPGFDGTVAAAGRVALNGTPATVPWRATAKLSADRDGLRAADIELRAGADLRALIAAGTGSADYPAGAPAPRAALSLHGATLDLDGLAVPPAASAVAPPKGLDLVRSLLGGDGTGLALGPALGRMPLLLDLDVAFDTATLAGRTALGTAAAVRLGPKPGAAVAFSVEGPEGARLALDGRVEAGPTPAVAGPFGAAPVPPATAFHGRVELRSSDLRRTAAWLRPAAPDLADWIAATVPGRSLRAAGALDASAARIAGHDLDLHLDGTALAGRAAFDPASGAAPARLTAALSADTLQLDRAPDLSAAAAASRGLDFDLSLTARAVRLAPAALGVAPTVGRAGPAAVAAGRVALHATRSGEDARLEELTLDLGGARLAASGSRDTAGARGELRAAASAVGPLADALLPLLPPAAAALLRTRAAALSPLDATLSLAAAAAPDGALAPTRLALAGTAGGTTVEAALAPDGPAANLPTYPPADASAAERPARLSLRAAAPRGADLLALLGVAVPGPVAGEARLSADAGGTLTGGFAGTLEAALGGTTATFVGRTGALAGGAGGVESGAGRLALHSPDISPALLAAGLPRSAGDPARALPAEAAGELGWDGAAARWRDLSARVGGAEGAAITGELSLDLAARRAPSGEPLPALRGRLAVDRLPAATLLGLALGPGATPAQPSGGAWSSTPFAAPASLPRAELALTVGALPLTAPTTADPPVARDVSVVLRTAPGRVALDELALSVAGGTASGALSFRRDGPGDGPGNGSGATLSGRVAWRDLALDAGGLAARASGSLDLAAAGASPAALAASLAGTGTAALSGAALARTDPAAPARVAAAAAARDALAERGSTAPAPTPPDAEALRRDLGAALDAGPLALGDAAGPAVLAGGVLRFGPVRRSGAASLPRPGQGGTVAEPWTAEASLALDLGALAATTRVVLRAGGSAGAGAGAGGRGAEATVMRAGPLGGSDRRTLDVGGLVEAVQAAAIARAQDRIDLVEQDIRERAAFNRQLKAIAQRQQAEREQAEAARRAEAVRQAEAAAQRAAAEAQARAAALRAAAEAQRQAAEQARTEAARQKAEQAEQAERKADEARVQAQVEAAARADRDRAEKRRPSDRAPLPADPSPPPSIIDERRTD